MRFVVEVATNPKIGESSAPRNRLANERKRFYITINSDKTIAIVDIINVSAEH